MGLSHVSEGLKDFYFMRARKVLHDISEFGIESIAYFEELNLLLELGFLSHPVVYNAIDSYESNRVINRN